MLRQLALVLLLVAVMVQAESPWRRRQRGYWPAERRESPRDIFERDLAKRAGSCEDDAECDSGEYCKFFVSMMSVNGFCVSL